MTHDGRTLSSLRDLIGAIIDERYEVRSLLGSGGMGAVYEAMQLQLDRRVAIKILNPVFMHRDDYVARFMQEAKTASRIRHENVVQVLDFGTLDNGSVYSVMELLEGRDLARMLRREKKLPWALARALLLQAIRGVKAAHAQGVIHRDIKPANLFLARDTEENREVLKVLDFGIARLHSDATDTAALTGTSDLLGTPAYMAPELARGRRAGPRTEVYSLGVVAYQMLTGEVPFRGDSAFDALFRAATEPTPPLRDHDPTIPPYVEELVLRMLAKDPHDRFADMAALHREVASIDQYGLPAAGPITMTGPQPTAEVSASALLPSPADTLSVRAPSIVTIPDAHVVLLTDPSRRRVQIAAAAVGALALVGIVAFTATADDAHDAPRIGAVLAAEDATEPTRTLAADRWPADGPPTLAADIVGSELGPSDAVREPEPEPEPSAEIVIEVEDDRPATIPRTSKAEPPTDAEILRKLHRRAKQRCRVHLAGDVLTVTFGIGQRGEVIAPRGSGSTPATECVIRLLAATRFTPGRMRKEVMSL